MAIQNNPNPHGNLNDNGVIPPIPQGIFTNDQQAYLDQLGNVLKQQNVIIQQQGETIQNMQQSMDNFKSGVKITGAVVGGIGGAINQYFFGKERTAFAFVRSVLYGSLIGTIGGASAGKLIDIRNQQRPPFARVN